MHWLVPFIQRLSAPFIPVIEMLMPALGAAANRKPDNGDCAVAAFAVSTGLVGLFCILWASWMHVLVRHFRAKARYQKELADSAQQFREALLNGAADGVVVLRNGEEERQYFGDGKSLYEACLDSPRAGKAIRAIDELTEDGRSFALSLDAEGEEYALRGKPVAGRAVLYLQRDADAAERFRYQEVLEGLPSPVWMRDANRTITWANRAFLSVLGFSDIGDSGAISATLDLSEHSLIAQALEARAPAQGRGYVTVGGEPRVFAMTILPLRSGCTAGFAKDITATVRLESAVKRAQDVSRSVIERLPFAAALFDREHKLTSFNSAYASLWGFSADWLKQRPSYGDILEQLRDRRKIPEQRNFPEWKSFQLHSVLKSEKPVEEFWHLPGGRSIRVLTQPHLQEGTFVMQEDITQKLQLEASLNLLTQVQKATLDTLDRGIAIFGTDGRLVLHNAQFAGMWLLSESELTGQPHFAEIADRCATRIGRDGIWSLISCAVNSATPEKFGEWTKTVRADGRIISLSLARLPNGATVVTFTDVTDLERFSALRDKDAHAA